MRLFQGKFGRLRDVATEPNGFLYILTSNKDGRGLPDATDDKILRIVPLDNEIDDFENCISVGNLITESYPRQCRTEDGKYFVEQILEIPDWVRKNAKWGL